MQIVLTYTRVWQYEEGTFVKTPNTSVFKCMVRANKKLYIICISSIWKKKKKLLCSPTLTEIVLRKPFYDYRGLNICWNVFCISVTWNRLG